MSINRKPRKQKWNTLFTTITNPETGVSKTIGPSNHFIGDVDLFIGCAIIAIGIVYISCKANRKGHADYMKAEYNALKDLGLL